MLSSLLPSTTVLIEQTAKVQCFNTYCPAFVLVTEDMPPDMLLAYSTPGGPTHAYGFQIYQDTASGNWWLTYNDTQIGFWPKQIFSELAEAASYVACGGTTYSRPGELDPPMESGSFVIGDPKYDAYCANFAVLDKQLKIVKVDTEKFSDSDAYEVEDKGSKGSFGHLIYFGGPGGRPSDM